MLPERVPASGTRSFCVIPAPLASEASKRDDVGGGDWRAHSTGPIMPSGCRPLRLIYTKRRNVLAL
jgi:hypothetical protein